jgi:hypothetical protein
MATMGGEPGGRAPIVVEDRLGQDAVAFICILSIDMFFKVVKSFTPRESTFSALAISSNVDKISAADLHVAREQIDAAQAKIDRLMRELKIEQVNRREAEAICRVVAAKLHSSTRR